VQELDKVRKYLPRLSISSFKFRSGFLLLIPLSHHVMHICGWKCFFLMKFSLRWLHVWIFTVTFQIWP